MAGGVSNLFGKDQASWPEAFAGMRKAGRLVAECLDMLMPEIRSGNGGSWPIASDSSLPPG